MNCKLVYTFYIGLRNVFALRYYVYTILASM